MRTRMIAGTALVALALAACGESSTEPQSATQPQIKGPLLDRVSYPPGLVDNEHAAVRDTSKINNGYFGSGHHEPDPDTLKITLPT